MVNPQHYLKLALSPIVVVAFNISILLILNVIDVKKKCSLAVSPL